MVGQKNHTAVQNANAILVQVLSELCWDLPEAERVELNLAWHRLDGPPSPPGGAVICMVASLFIVVWTVTKMKHTGRLAKCSLYTY